MKVWWRSALLASLLACGDPDPTMPAPFVAQGTKAPAAGALYGAFSAQGDAFSLGVSTPSNTFYIWRSGQVVPLGRVANAASSVLLEGGDAALVLSEFAYVPTVGSAHAYILSLQRGGRPVWRRAVGSSNAQLPRVQVVGALAFAPSERGALVLELATGRVLRELPGAQPGFTAAELGGGLVALTGERTFVMRTDTGAPVCDAAPMELRSVPWALPPGLITSAVKAVDQVLVSRAGADCTFSPVAQGAYPTPVEGGFALTIDRDVPTEVPAPSLVEGDPARQQLVVFDPSGAPKRAIALPSGTRLAVPTRDLTRVFTHDGKTGTTLLDVATGAQVGPKTQLNFFSHASEDRQFLFFWSGTEVTSLDVKTDTLVRAPVSGVAGVFAGTLVVRSRAGDYQRLAFDTLKPLDTIRIP